MKDPMFLTIVFVVLSALVATFIRRVKKDKCLKDFIGYMVTLEKKDGKIIWGKLNVLNTGLELVYSELNKDNNGHVEASYLLYKHEYGAGIEVLIRYHDELSEANKKKRLKSLERTYHPGFFRKLRRKIFNIIKTVKDSVLEVVNLLISQAKARGPTKKMLTSGRDKYVNQMRDTLMDAVSTSYEPLLEMCIGCKVVLEIVKGDKVIELCGVLEDYTANFIEIMNVDYTDAEGKVRKVDLIVPRKVGIVRHLAEKKPESRIDALRKRKKLSVCLIITAGLLFLLSIFAAIKWRKPLIEKGVVAGKKVKTIVTDVNETEK